MVKKVLLVIVAKRMYLHQARLVGGSLGGINGLLERVQVGAVIHGLHVPAIGLVALRHVLGERESRVAIDGDVVVVVEDDQLSQTEVTRQRRRLRRY